MLCGVKSSTSGMYYKQGSECIGQMKGFFQADAAFYLSSDYSIYLIYFKPLSAHWFQDCKKFIDHLSLEGSENVDYGARRILLCCQRKAPLHVGAQPTSSCMKYTLSIPGCTNHQLRNIHYSQKNHYTRVNTDQVNKIKCE